MTHKIAIIGLGIMGRRMLENALQHPAFPDGHPNSPTYGHLKLLHLN